MFIFVAFEMLKAAGHPVTPAGDIPGLWNVEGLANDVTTGQLLDLARQHGHHWPFPLIGPAIRIDQVS
jgi:hypothetical protein